MKKDLQGSMNKVAVYLNPIDTLPMMWLEQYPQASKGM